MYVFFRNSIGYSVAENNDQSERFRWPDNVPGKGISGRNNLCINPDCFGSYSHGFGIREVQIESEAFVIASLRAVYSMWPQVHEELNDLFNSFSVKFIEVRAAIIEDKS